MNRDNWRFPSAFIVLYLIRVKVKIPYGLGRAKTLLSSIITDSI